MVHHILLGVGTVDAQTEGPGTYAVAGGNLHKVKGDNQLLLWRKEE